MMSEQGMAAADVEGTGRGGRITKGDVLAAVAQPKAAAPAAAPKPAPAAAPWRQWPRKVRVPSSACRCRACAPASPNAWCSRNRRRPSSRRSTK
ncbi:MAG: E3 binding domain-containing protein [Betaproteobacteria bacterium]|nr:E3 binding domain-containing protein [Betaproteobacteria bacterium]